MGAPKGQNHRVATEAVHDGQLSSRAQYRRRQALVQVLETERDMRKHLRRINPDLLIDPPELDAVAKVAELARLGRDLLAGDPKLRECVTSGLCACRLVFLL